MRLRKATEFSKIPFQELYNLNNVCKVLRRAYGSKTHDNLQDALQTFCEAYPDYAELAEKPYEDIAAYHILCMMQLQDVFRVKQAQSWGEPMYTGRGNYPYDGLDADRYQYLIHHPEDIFKEE